MVLSFLTNTNKVQKKTLSKPHDDYMMLREMHKDIITLNTAILDGNGSKQFRHNPIHTTISVITYYLEYSLAEKRNSRGEAR